MPRPKRIISSGLPYHLYARCSNKTWFQLPLATVWQIYSDYLFFLNKAFDVKIHSFVLMNNHFHLLATPAEPNLPEAMNYFMRETSRVIGFETHRINQVYGGPYGATLITNDHHFRHAYKYVYRNPVDGGLVKCAEDYSFSTLSGLLGRRPVTIPLIEDPLLFDLNSVQSTVNWLNKPFETSSRSEIKAALRKSAFKLSLNKLTKRKSHLETELS